MSYDPTKPLNFSDRNNWRGNRSGVVDDDGQYNHSNNGSNTPGRRDWWNSERDGDSIYASSLVTYVIATCYISFLCFIALIMCFKTMTRLRVIAAILTFMGLSIAVVGYLRANNNVLPNVYWAWNFLAEALAVIAMTIAIVSVGSGFYPMTGKRSIYARLSFGVIFLYAVVSMTTFIYYVYERCVKHTIPAAEVVELRTAIVKSGLFTQEQLDYYIKKAALAGAIPMVNTAIVGARDYTELSMPEQTYYMRPLLGFYLGHQLMMLSTCVWVVMYLFIPLVKHHRHGPAGRSVDSDMMAIGVWYLTCLMSLATVRLCFTLLYFLRAC